MGAILALTVPILGLGCTNDVEDRLVPDYQIFSEVINSWSNAEAVVVIDHSLVDPTFDLGSDNASAQIRSYFADISLELVNNYISKNQVSTKLYDTFITAKKVVLISNEELDEILGEPLEIRNYLYEYSGFSTLKFSQVGFSEDGTEALVFVDFSLAGFGGGGSYFWYRINGTQWALVEIAHTYKR